VGLRAEKSDRGVFAEYDVVSGDSDSSSLVQFPELADSSSVEKIQNRRSWKNCQQFGARNSAEPQKAPGISCFFVVTRSPQLVHSSRLI
jgi:hypothetical protein